MIIKLANRLGLKILNFFLFSFEICKMVYFTTKTSITRMREQSFIEILKVILAQIYFTGFQAMPLIGLLALITGSFAILQSVSQLSKLGGGEMLGNLLVVLIVRELGPLIVALVVIARSGTAVASEIGNMRVNSEITLLESVGINPLSYIVFPRIVAGVVSVVCLGFFFSMVALFGGYFLVNIIHPISFDFFSESIANAISGTDVLLFLLKNIFSGLIIFSVSCYQGMSVKSSFTEVPRMTTSAVMNSILYTVSFNSLVSLGVYLQSLKQLGIL